MDKIGGGYFLVCYCALRSEKEVRARDLQFLMFILRELLMLGDLKKEDKNLQKQIICTI